jgi:hypothetical protein
MLFMSKFSYNDFNNTGIINRSIYDSDKTHDSTTYTTNYLQDGKAVQYWKLPQYFRFNAEVCLMTVQKNYVWVAKSKF